MSSRGNLKDFNLQITHENGAKCQKQVIWWSGEVKRCAGALSAVVAVVVAAAAVAKGVAVAGVGGVSTSEKQRAPQGPC